MVVVGTWPVVVAPTMVAVIFTAVMAITAAIGATEVIGATAAGEAMAWDIGGWGSYGGYGGWGYGGWGGAGCGLPICAPAPVPVEPVVTYADQVVNVPVTTYIKKCVDVLVNTYVQEVVKVPVCGLAPVC